LAKLFLKQTKSLSDQDDMRLPPLQLMLFSLLIHVDPMYTGSTEAISKTVREPTTATTFGEAYTVLNDWHQSCRSLILTKVSLPSTAERLSALKRIVQLLCESQSDFDKSWHLLHSKLPANPTGDQINTLYDELSLLVAKFRAITPTLSQMLTTPSTPSGNNQCKKWLTPSGCSWADGCHNKVSHKPKGVPHCKNCGSESHKTDHCKRKGGAARTKGDGKGDKGGVRKLEKMKEQLVHKHKFIQQLQKEEAALKAKMAEEEKAN
jgi:hypothetical protein